MTALAGLEYWHLGAVVADIQVALEAERALGAVACSNIARLDSHTYDASTGEVVHECIDVAWVRQKHGTVELICPLGPEGPQARLLEQRPGVSHRAYWCEDAVTASRSIAELGGTLYLAVLQPGSEAEADMRHWPLDQIVANSQACYFLMPGGSIIEINPQSGRKSMKQAWGEDIDEILGLIT